MECTIYKTTRGKATKITINCASEEKQIGMPLYEFFTVEKAASYFCHEIIKKDYASQNIKVTFFTEKTLTIGYSINLLKSELILPLSEEEIKEFYNVFIEEIPIS